MRARSSSMVMSCSENAVTIAAIDALVLARACSSWPRFLVTGFGRARPLQPLVDLGADEGGVGEQAGDVVPDDRIDVVGADRLVAADAAALVAVVVGAEAPVVVDLLPGAGRGGGAVVAVAAGRAGGQALQQRRDLGVPGREPLVVFQPLLDPVERVLVHQGRDRDRGPFLARAVLDPDLAGDGAAGSRAVRFSPAGSWTACVLPKTAVPA